MLRKKKNIPDLLYKSINIYHPIGVNTIGTTLRTPNVNLQSVSTLPNFVVSPFINSTIENNITTNQAFSYFNGGNLVPEAHQPSGTYNGSRINNVMPNLVIPESHQPTGSTNINAIDDDDDDDDW